MTWLVERYEVIDTLKENIIICLTMQQHTFYAKI